MNKVDITKKSLKEMFPNLSKEMEEGENKVQIDSMRADAEKAEQGITDFVEEESQEPLDMFRHYNPCAVDFIRRCNTVAQAKEIIDFLEKKGEITTEYANELRAQLEKDGVRSFGSKKEENYYFKQSGLC